MSMGSIADILAAGNGRRAQWLPVRREDEADWRDALKRGQGHQLQVHHQSGFPLSEGLLRRALVPSYAEPHVQWSISVVSEFGGQVQVSCTCSAGQQRRPCSHAAVTIEALGAWPFQVRDTCAVSIRAVPKFADTIVAGERLFRIEAYEEKFGSGAVPMVWELVDGPLGSARLVFDGAAAGEVRHSAGFAMIAARTIATELGRAAEAVPA